MTRRHPHHPRLEEADYLEDPNFVMEVLAPDEEGKLSRVEVGYGYLIGTKKTGYKTRYVFHDDPASRHHLAVAEGCETRRFQRRHRAEDWASKRAGEPRYRFRTPGGPKATV